jgi:RNA polymerase sigma-70 factor (ECF subfamily)
MEPLDFGRLYATYSKDVFRFALYLTGSRAEAEDITSETFVRALAGSDVIRVATVKAYLLMIARNLYIDSRRREVRHVELTYEPPDPAPNPEAVSGSKSALRAATSALQRLQEIDRAALLMRAVHGLGYDEIARALGLSVAAARVKVHRARLKLAAVCEGDDRS